MNFEMKKDRKGNPVPSSIKISFDNADINERQAAIADIQADVAEIKNHLIILVFRVNRYHMGITWCPPLLHNKSCNYDNNLFGHPSLQVTHLRPIHSSLESLPEN